MDGRHEALRQLRRLSQLSSGGSVPPDVSVQARRCFEIIERALARIDDVVRTRMFLVDAADADAVGRVHGKVFGPRVLRQRWWSCTVSSIRAGAWKWKRRPRSERRKPGGDDSGSAALDDISERRKQLRRQRLILTAAPARRYAGGRWWYRIISVELLARYPAKRASELGSEPRMRQHLRSGMWLPVSYLGLVGFAALYLGYRLLFAVENSEFAGMPLLLLSLPWSDWLAPIAGKSLIGGWLGLISGVLVNAVMLGLVGRGLTYLFIVGSGSDAGTA